LQKTVLKIDKLLFVYVVGFSVKLQTSWTPLIKAVQNCVGLFALLWNLKVSHFYTFIHHKDTTKVESMQHTIRGMRERQTDSKHHTNMHSENHKSKLTGN